MRSLLLVALLLWLQLAAGAQPLTLQDLLEQVETHHPVLRQADLALAMARARVTEKEGAFDPALALSSGYQRYNSSSDPGKAKEAIPWLERAAEKGHAEAQALLGLAYLTGRGVDRAPTEALKRLKPAAEKGYPKAEALLALALLNTAEVRDEAEGRRITRKAAADGDPLGQALLGELLLFGRAGMAKNEAEGAAWMRKAAEQADARAQYMLASLLANGLGVDKDPVQARFWLEL
ncbi:hypothetical protein DYH09_20185, partial [bacterium CPR1]|nr:hypothetical protein [bacterium CPR1]